MFCRNFFFPFIGGNLFCCSVCLDDVRIRKAIRNSIEKESELIGDIGDAELDMELRDKVFSMMDKLSRRLQEDTQVESSLTEEDIRDYTNKVIQEVIRRKVSK